MNTLNYLLSLASTVSGYLWGSIILILLISVGLFFAVASKFSQLMLFKQAIKVLMSSNKNTTHHLSSFQALSTALGSLIGIGSIAGMSIAIGQGGPGAIFWLWIVAILGMGLSLVENTLGQVYKKEVNNTFVGGPAYYIAEGLKSKAFAIVFSVALLFTYGAVFSSVQANTIGQVLQTQFNFNITYVAITLTAFTGLVILGGIHRIAKVAAVLLPLMGVAYIGLALLLIIKNITLIPHVFSTIFSQAFGAKQVAYGVAGGTLMQVFIVAAKRALFASEAGLGSAPNITASSYVKHPVEQGLVGMMAVFIITFIICTATGIIVVAGGLYNTTNLQGIALVQQSLVNLVGQYSVYILVFSIFVFGFTSIIGNYAYAQSNMAFLSPKNYKLYLYGIKLFALASVYFGTILPLDAVWSLTDLFSGIMVLLNVTALILLSKVFLAVLKDYKQQLAQGKTPQFKASSIKGLPEYTKQIWK